MAHRQQPLTRIVVALGAGRREAAQLGGSAAGFYDQTQAIATHVPLALGLLVVVFVFQHGRLSGLLAYSSQGGIEQADFLVLEALVFALSTDYRVLLLTRIKELRDRGVDDREAVSLGLERTGRLVSASAVLLAVAIGADGAARPP